MIPRQQYSIMALFMKQDFTPALLSRKWVAIKLRPNYMLHSRQHIIDILESGLLFREDSIEVEQDAPDPHEVWVHASGGARGWFTRGECALAAALTGGAAVALRPRTISRSALLYLLTLSTIPVSVRVCHRRLAWATSLRELLASMRQYLALSRRAAACVKECGTLCRGLSSVSAHADSTRALLRRQQSSLAATLARASSALLGNAPWLRAGDLTYRPGADTDTTSTIHHAFLVVQSTFLKHVAMVHYVQPTQAKQLYRNHNERIYWIHTVLIHHLCEEFKENFEALERMYRLLKNYGNKDFNVQKTPGTALSNSWLYSDVHAGIARASLELKMAAEKCTNLDMFLDNCALYKEDIDLTVLNKDIDDLIEGMTGCLSTVQSSQMRLKKLKMKFCAKDDREKTDSENIDRESTEILQDKNILTIEDKEPEIRDEVFYCVKTEDDDTSIEPASDLTTGPGKKERDTTKVVLNELKRKLVKREDIMRERERQALIKTMLIKDNVPEFPRQMDMESEKKGYMTKLHKRVPKRRLFRSYRISPERPNKFCSKKFELHHRSYKSEDDIVPITFDAAVNLKKNARHLVTIVAKPKKSLEVTVWYKYVEVNNAQANAYFDVSDLSEGLSDIEANATNKTLNDATNRHTGNGDSLENGAKNIKFSKRDLELSMSSSESDFDYLQERSLLKDIRRHRVARKKNHPVKRGSISIEKEEDESLKPVEYSFGTGMALASVLQVNNARANFAQEEVFLGDGEVSNDSGNDEDA